MGVALISLVIGPGASDADVAAPLPEVQVKAPEVPAPAPCATPWTSTHLVATKGLLKASIDIEAAVLDGDPARAAARDLGACPEIDGRLPDCTCLIRLESVTDAPFSSPRRTVAFVHPDHGSMQYESWQGHSHVRHRDCQGQRHSTRWKMKKGCDELVRERDRVASADAAKLPVVDGSSLAWFASARRLDREGAKFMVAAWSGDVLVPVRLEAREIVALERRDQGPVDARRVSLEADSGEEEEEEASVAPFGLKGEVSLYLELGTGRVLALEGDSVKIGHIRATNADAGIR